MKILLLSAVLLGPAAFRFCSLAQETKTAASLEALGGKVVLAQGSVSQLSFTDCSKLGDAEFRAIGSLAHLKSLTLYGKCHGLDDTTIVHLAGLKELESIGTDGAQLTD
ncbi:MAG: hypothetical protein JWO89_3769, partial [Verrucomicrobiaceae bacterium]|nr:hypothetical protein [Verrucomicrobiaceae bacterium]